MYSIEMVTPCLDETMETAINKMLSLLNKHYANTLEVVGISFFKNSACILYKT